jgi:AcrR family transcriptional regulator
MARQPTGLSRERILQVAIGVAEREGIDALSMRRLAQELDVWPMSVYRYFQDKDALLDAMAAAAAGDVPEPAADASWRDQMRALLDAARRSIASSPGVAARLPRAFLTPSALRLSEAGMAILTRSGLSSEEAASAWRSLWTYTFGFATFQVESARTVRAAVAGLPEDDYPVLAETANELSAALADDDEFDVGLELILDGIEERLPARA